MDALGVDIVFLRAKQQEAGRIVSIGELREFSGALDMLGITKGVFVTTSAFSEDAKNVAQSISGQKRLHLIDGKELLRLMMEYGAGVRKRRIFTVECVDNSYFDEIEK